MYRKLKAMFIVLCFFGVNSIATATEFTKGDYYVEIEGTFTKQKELREFFSFYCPHCFKQESVMHELEASLPTDASFIKNHVDGMPGRDIKIEEGLTKALITAKALKIDSEIIEEIFKHIHVKRADFSSATDIKKIFLSNGVDSAKFDKIYNSFSVNMQLKKMQKRTASLRKQGIGSVPTLIINGKYMPVTSKLKGLDEYKELIAFLLNKTS